VKLLILHQFFYPDHSAVSQLMTDLSESLVARGVDVTALAGRGLYNGGQRLPERDTYKGVIIGRAWSTSYGKRSFIGRLMDYISFYIGATYKLFRLPHHDILMVLTNPPLIVLLGLIVGRIRGMRTIALMQDIYPDLAIKLGAISPRNPLTSVLNYINTLALRNVDRIIVLGECMRERIINKTGTDAASRIDVIPNWADGEEIKPLSVDEDNPFLVTHNLKDKFVVLFSGNFGLVNDYATVLDAARQLSHRSDIVFLFIGDGAKANYIKEFSKSHNLNNIIMLPYQPRDMVRYSLAAGHALLVTLANGLAGLSVPSKTYAILAAGRPVLFVGDSNSDVAKLVTESGCGEVVNPNDSERLIRVITGWASNREKLMEVGKLSRKIFESRFNRHHAVSAYLESFFKCVDSNPTYAEGELIRRTES
jgi:colanic acid biosynthesis glycosyl transferase WcaI